MANNKSDHNSISNLKAKTYDKLFPNNGKSKRHLRILAIDGGGVKGYFTAYALKKLYDEFNINFVDEFDLVVGTSTGSIIGASLLMGFDYDEIYRQYNEFHDSMFKRNTIVDTLRMPLFPQYDSKFLKTSLENYFGDLTLRDLYDKSQKSFLFTATNYNEGKPVIFGSPNLSPLNSRYQRYLLKDAILSSAAAPLYFSPYSEEITDDWIVDGGIWSNNPLQVALMYALGDMGYAMDEISIFSFGQTFVEGVSVKPNVGRSLLKDFRNNELSVLYSATLLAQMNFSNLFCTSTLKERFFRYAPEMRVDNSKTDFITDKFKEYAHLYYEQNKEDVLYFLKNKVNRRYQKNDEKRYN